MDNLKLTPQLQYSAIQRASLSLTNMRARSEFHPSHAADSAALSINHGKNGRQTHSLELRLS